jgi:hypothetical protein
MARSTWKQRRHTDHDPVDGGVRTRKRDSIWRTVSHEKAWFDEGFG